MNQTAKRICGLAFLAVSTQGFALDNIIRPYQSVRSSGMGGVRLTTGLYDENFFGNPARASANPTFRFTFLDPMVEINGQSLSTANKLLGGGDVIQKIADTEGSNNHLRVQTTFPAIYFPTGEESKLAFAFSLLTSVQADVIVRRDYELSTAATVDIGPAFTVSRKFLEDDTLAVGLTAHMVYRLSAKPNFTLTDLLKGTSLSPLKNGGEGAMIDFDLGGTYVLPWRPADYELTVGLALNNILGGGYNNLKIRPANLDRLPAEQPRTLGFGVAARKPTLFLEELKDNVLALEFTDIGNNPNGSLFRTVHIGAETHYGVLAGRLGLNQGYLCFGLGLGFKAFTLDLATYGEELSLNTGGLQDRRWALRFAFQI